jgi:hypothetical protein
MYLDHLFGKRESATGPGSAREVFMAPIKLIRVPTVKPITTGGPLSFKGVLKMEKRVDALYAADGLAKYEVPLSKAPKSIVKSGFTSLKAYKIPVADLYGAGTKGTLFATRASNRPEQDVFSLHTAKGTLLAVRQKSGDYNEGFFWSNYRVK